MGKQRHQTRPLQSDEAREKKEHAAEVDQSLTAIFGDGAGDQSDLTKLEQHKTNIWAWVFGITSALIVTLICAIWFGLVGFKPFQGFNGKGLQLTIDGPERVALGQETTYFINYQNVSTDPLGSAEVRLSFPPDFTVTSIDPMPTSEGLVWRLGAIPFGGRGTLTIKGIFSGALGTQTAIQAVGTYRPGSFSSDFEELATRKLDYAESVLDGVIDMPAKALPGDRVRVSYLLQNRGANPLAQLEARISLPPGFVREASSTGSLVDERVVRLPVGMLVAGGTSTVSVVGTFASGASGDLPIHAEVGRVNQNGVFQAAQKTDAVLSVLAGDLLLKLVVNGSDADRSVSERDPLRFALAFENTSPEEIKDITLRFRVEPVPNVSTTPTFIVANIKKAAPVPKFVEWSQLEDSASGTVSGNTVTWDKTHLGALERLPPQTDGTIEFSVPVSVISTSTSDIPFQVTVEGTMASVGKTVINRTIKTKPIVFRLRTDADLTSEARYFSEEGAPLGAGPLPPVTGQTTTYRVQWSLTKTRHELSNIRVSAVLPQNVTWPAKSALSAGDISFDQSTRLISWTLNRLPVNVNEASANFDIQFIPTEADAGRFAQLLGEARFETIDMAINEPIVKTKPHLTTDLQNDDGAKSKGVVKKP